MGLMTKLAFIDTETTSLRPDRRAWEIGVIVREEVQTTHPDRPPTFEPRQTEHSFFVEAQDLDMANADLFSLRVGRFHERHPEMKYVTEVQKMYSAGVSPLSEGSVLLEVEYLTRDAHLVGANVRFDAEVLDTRMRAHGILPSWDYHLIDIEALALGYLRAKYVFDKSEPDPEAPVVALPGVPWKSSMLTAALGVEDTPEGQKHTALGDAIWAMRMYDRVMGAV